MRKFSSIVLLILIFTTKPSHATSIEVSLAQGSVDSSPQQALSGMVSWPVWKPLDEDLKVVFGARYSFFSRASELNLGASKSVAISDLELHAINALFGANYNLTERLSVGMSLDFIGLTIGKETQARNGLSQIGTASPKAFNLLLGGSRDLGTLNSEFYVGYILNNEWMLKAGISHQVVEFDTTLTDEKAQRFLDLVFLGLRYVL